MKVKGLDGRIYGWQMHHFNNILRDHSSLHNKAKILIKDLFRSDELWEEVILPGTKPPLYADFVLPFRRLVIEVHGTQHYQQVEFFHSKKEFRESRIRDIKKKEWCQLNNLILIELPYMEDINEWRKRIIEFGG
jgi:hypothetical protein